MKILINFDKTEQENCILCNKPTNYLKTTDISKRNFYVTGCGQLCENCYKQTFKK